MDIDPFRSSRSFVDERLGIRETFLTPTLAGGRTVAVLSSPVGAALPLGWVLCHSFGLEFGYLQPLEVLLARALAREGFPVLRFHAQGYGDSELSLPEAGIKHHLDSAIGAAALIARTAPVSHVGFAGARFGGTIGALAGQGIDASALILWDPIVRGASYLRALFRQELASRVTSGDGAASGDKLAVLREQGLVDLQGIPMRRELFDEISGIDLVRDLARPPRRALIVQVSTSRTPKADLERLRSHLSGLGGDCSLEFATSVDAARFGGPKFKPVGDGKKVDLQAEIGDVLTQVTNGWIRAADWERGVVA